ncbi:MAG TPA: CrcB family protein [Acidimicrobiales bacterium]|nr:CrcB family protein [Acidimicrobiales bacterium]
MTPTATKRRHRRLDYGGRIITRVETSRAGGTPAPAPHTRPAALVSVLCGGALGAASRYAISQAWPTPTGGFPIATMSINLSGSFVLGLLLEALVRSGGDRGWRRSVRLFAGTGFCGAFTTYSTLAVETVQLGRHGAWGTGALYLAVSVTGGIVAAAAGIAAGAVGATMSTSRLPVDPDLDIEDEQ